MALKNANNYSPLPSSSRCREDSTESAESDALKNASDDDEADTDLETDRLLGHQRSTDDVGFYDSDKSSWMNSNKKNSLLSKLSPKIPHTMSGHCTKPPHTNSNIMRHAFNSAIPSPVPEHPSSPKTQSSHLMDISESMSSPDHSDKDNHGHSPVEQKEVMGRNESPGGVSMESNTEENEKKKKGSSKSKEVLIEGVLFRAKYLGSTQLVCEGQPTKSTRMMQAEEAVSRIRVSLVCDFLLMMDRHVNSWSLLTYHSAALLRLW